MSFWGSKPKQSKRSNIPMNLPIGGLLSEFGGPNDVIEYRVWAKTVEGKDFFLADPEFQGALKIWRRFEKNLDYHNSPGLYSSIELPRAVVWDPGGNQYREVTLDTFKQWIIKSVPFDAEAYRKEKEIERLEKEKADKIEKMKKEIEQSDLLASGMSTTGEKMGEYKFEPYAKLSKKQEKAMAEASKIRAAGEEIAEIPSGELKVKAPKRRKKSNPQLSNRIRRLPFHNPRLPFELPGGTDIIRRRRNAGWSTRRYRGKTSMNVPEALGMTNKQVVGAVVLITIPILAYVAYKAWKAGQTQEVAL